MSKKSGISSSEDKKRKREEENSPDDRLTSSKLHSVITSLASPDQHTVQDDEDDELNQVLASNAQTPPRKAVIAPPINIMDTFKSRGFENGHCDTPVIVAPVFLKEKLVGLVTTGTYSLSKANIIHCTAPNQVDSTGKALLQLTTINTPSLKVICERGQLDEQWKDHPLFQQFGVVASSCFPLHIKRCEAYYEHMGLSVEEKALFGSQFAPQPVTREEVTDRRARCERLIEKLKSLDGTIFRCHNAASKEYDRKVRVVEYVIDVQSNELLEQLLCFTVCQ